MKAVNIEKQSPIYWHESTQQRLRIVEVRSSGMCVTTNRSGENRLVMIGELKTLY